MPRETILEYRHPVDGEIRLELVGDQVHLSCRWPFDLSTDEWIELSNSFSAEIYSTEVRRLEKGESATIPGIENGEIRLAVNGEGRLRFHAVTSYTELVTILNVTPGDLLLP